MNQKQVFGILIAVILLFGLAMSGKHFIQQEPYQITTETFSQGEATLKYPQLHGLKDPVKEKAINALIRDDLKSQVNLDSIGPIDIFELDLNYQVTLHTPELLSILYTGTSTYYTGRPDVRSSCRISDDIYATTIDLHRMERLKLSDFMDINMDLVRKIKQSENVTNEAVKSGYISKEQMQTIVKDVSDEYLLDDLTSDDHRAYYAFCLTPDSFLVSTSIASALGNYVLIEVDCPNASWNAA
ncbi:DUF4163 domain-containing protein [Clostridium sp. D33t1_170424_F3]|uniref:DUF4163 domain-containing protein n=1 Tax=Clostridium sp. D33t1_170424_F3 TaxID=2787099 RepID=UPI0018AA3E35|nr:DUF4163 domain-containing protein [Clostridium sp. D33t1_170424_F3]